MTDASAAGALAGQVALITGAGRGQGAEHALALAGAGAAIVALDIGADIDGFYPMSTESDLATTIASVEALGAEALAVTADVRDFDAVTSAVTAAHARFGTIDIVCNNAGICRVEAIDEISDRSLDAVIDTNVKGLFSVARATVPIMKAQGRRIHHQHRLRGNQSHRLHLGLRRHQSCRDRHHQELGSRARRVERPRQRPRPRLDPQRSDRRDRRRTRPRHQRNAVKLARPASTPRRVSDRRRHRRDGGLPGNRQGHHRTDLRCRRRLEHPLSRTTSNEHDEQGRSSTLISGTR